MPLLVIQTIHRGCKGSDDIVSSNTSISIGIQKPTTVCSFNSKHILTTQHDIISSRDSQPQSSTECITKPFSQQFPSRVFQRHSRPSVWCLCQWPTPYMVCTPCVLDVPQNFIVTKGLETHHLSPKFSSPCYQPTHVTVQRVPRQTLSYVEAEVVS